MNLPSSAFTGMIPPHREPFAVFTGKAAGLPASLLRPGGDDHGTRSGNFRRHDCSRAWAAVVCADVTQQNREREYERDPEHCGDYRTRQAHRKAMA
jgi:hypothetical protein